MSSHMDEDQDDMQISRVSDVNDAEWRQTRNDLADSFRNELERLCNLVDCIEMARASKYWILDTVLELKIDPRRGLDFILRLGDRVANSSRIHGFWLEDGGSTVFIRMGEDFWQSTRCDMFQGSRAISAANNDPVDSPRRIQTVRVFCGKSIRELEWRFTKEHEIMAHFLRISLRLNHRDITIVMRSLAGIGAKWESFGCRKIEKKLDDEVRSFPGGKAIMVRAAFDALRRAVAEGFLYKLPKAFADSRKLVELGDDHKVSAANMSFQGIWTVLGSFESRKAKNFLRKTQPSFFKQWDGDVHCGPQIHVLDKLIQDRRHCFLVQFPGEGEPDSRTVMLAMDQLRDSLGAKRDSDDVVTLPFRMDKRSSTWFRVDGDEDVDFRLKVLSDKLRRAIDAAIVPGAIKSTQPIPDLAVAGRAPATIIIWARQSGEETLKAGSMSRQLTTLLHAVYPWVIPGDHLDVFAETCSTNKHPLDDRNMWRGLLRDKPLYILTTNPDRLTRRAEEVDRICAELKSLGGGWYVLGDSLGSEHWTSTWYKLEGATVDVVKARLQLGRNIAKEAGFHGRQYQATIRLCDFLDRNDIAGQRPKQALDLANVLNLVKEAHGYRRVLLVSHISPSWADKSEVSVDPSITRQIKALRTLTSGMSNRCSSFRCQKESKHKRTFIDQLMRRIKGLHGRTLVMTVSVDRVCSDMSAYKRLKDALEYGGNGLLSFTWDHETLLDVSEALQLGAPWNGRPEVAAWEESLKSQERAPRVSTNLPMIQPILWIGGNRQQASSPASLAGERHVQQAQNFIQAFSMTKFQGYAHTENELLRENGKYTTKKDEQKWKKYVVRRGRTWGNDGVNGNGGDDQARDDSGNDEAGDMPEQKNSRTCLGQGCDTELPLKGSRTCRACIEERNRSRECWNPSCQNNAPHPGPKACATCQGQGPGSKWYDDTPGLFRRCDIRGCNELAPVGERHGLYCSDRCRILGKVQKLREQAANAPDAAGNR
ncbi:uncharacterized protein MYCFIDRAFT_79193 [Pseudocercospora fijiensis CIRAD86]|uniref:Uncharacterized protein n=1 Tax=Pseudocercospora fijiensis (strain CIRAD86) TaxID=383855 RepID=M2ZFM7_PSEFD|nr:uncharacterized protein MYCFIDRAFT_79193 [Pseudocercospora fijiensis CIRAD86]EME77949.1 hypothetical protein MYCFIDRAFT_79193 [Pseudocercospora fijiensis CIRAD86]